MELLEAARSAPSSANCQPVRYILVDNEEMAKQIFPELAWAGYVQPRRNPPAGGEPVAYIVVLVDGESATSAGLGSVDAAAAIENIMLAAWSKGIGSCWIGSVKRENAKKILSIPDEIKIDSIVALGYPDEEPLMEDAEGEGIKYYLDDKDRLHVTKRRLKNIASVNKYGQDIW